MPCSIICPLHVGFREMSGKESSFQSFFPIVWCFFVFVLPGWGQGKGTRSEIFRTWHGAGSLQNHIHIRRARGPNSTNERLDFFGWVSFNPRIFGLKVTFLFPIWIRLFTKFPRDMNWKVSFFLSRFLQSWVLFLLAPLMKESVVLLWRHLFDVVSLLYPMVIFGLKWFFELWSHSLFPTFFLLCFLCGTFSIFN